MIGHNLDREEEDEEDEEDEEEEEEEGPNQFGGYLSPGDELDSDASVPVSAKYDRKRGTSSVGDGSGLDLSGAVTPNPTDEDYPPYLVYDTDNDRNSVGEEFSGDDLELESSLAGALHTAVSFEPTIQDAIKRQQQREAQAQRAQACIGRVPPGQIGSTVVGGETSGPTTWAQVPGVLQAQAGHITVRAGVSGQQQQGQQVGQQVSGPPGTPLSKRAAVIENGQTVMSNQGVGVMTAVQQQKQQHQPQVGLQKQQQHHQQQGKVQQQQQQQPQQQQHTSIQRVAADTSVASHVPLRLTPLRNVSSVPVLDSKPIGGGPFRHVIRLPRGRHPLRGPFGQLLDTQMSKSDVTRKQQQQQGGGRSIGIKEEDDTMSSFIHALTVDQQQQKHPGLRQVQSDMGATHQRYYNSCK